MHIHLGGGGLFAFIIYYYFSINLKLCHEITSHDQLIFDGTNAYIKSDHNNFTSAAKN